MRQRVGYDEEVRAATDHAVNACGRLAGAEMPTLPNSDATIPELKERIAKTIEFIKGLKPAQIDGSEDKEIKITFPSGAVREFTGQSLLLNNSLPNFYFHCTTAYDILRHCGIELGRVGSSTPASLPQALTAWSVAARTCRPSGNMSGASRVFSSTDGSTFLASA